MRKQYIDAKEISIIMDVSEGKAYQIIRNLNKELKEKGYITIAGKVSRKYFSEKFYGYVEEESVK